MAVVRPLRVSAVDVGTGFVVELLLSVIDLDVDVDVVAVVFDVLFLMLLLL